MADIPTLPPPPGGRPTHPLAKRGGRPAACSTPHSRGAGWTIADAARKFSRFVGEDVPYQTWMAWERYDDEPGARLPSRAYMEKLFLFTRGAIRPDNFYPIGEWRRQLAEDAGAQVAAECGAGALVLEPAGEG
jgi:hypothetical protein